MTQISFQIIKDVYTIMRGFMKVTNGSNHVMQGSLRYLFLHKPYTLPSGTASNMLVIQF